MISLKKYLDSETTNPANEVEPDGDGVASAAIAAYSSALVEMGRCSLEVCPGLGGELKLHLGELSSTLSCAVSRTVLQSTDKAVQEQLRNWGGRTARHYQQKSDEVKELLIVMAKMAESFGTRDQRCAGQINAVTARLTAIASLDDLTEIRTSIETSAAELRSSIEKMTEEGEVAIDLLRAQVSTYRVKLEKAEVIASRDSLTGLRNRMCVENQIENLVSSKAAFCVAIVDIDGFKKVNDDFGHLAGDELLKQFATELISACRSKDVIGRWGGDEFILVLECGLPEARARIERLSKWVCGHYTIPVKAGTKKLRVDASIGLAEYRPKEPINDLIARADAAMYQQKAASRTSRSASQK